MRKFFTTVGFVALLLGLCMGVSACGMDSNCENRYPLFTAEVEKMDDALDHIYSCETFAEEFTKYYNENEEALKAAIKEYDETERLSSLSSFTDMTCSLDESLKLSKALRDFNDIQEQMEECQRKLNQQNIGPTSPHYAYLVIMGALVVISGWEKLVQDAIYASTSSGDDDDD